MIDMKLLKNILYILGMVVLGILVLALFLVLVATPPFGWIILLLIAMGHSSNSEQREERKRIALLWEQTQKSSVPDTFPIDWIKTNH